MNPTCKNTEETVREFARKAYGIGEADRVREAIDTVTENLYQRLPSGDYGRGDVRRAILDELDRLDNADDAVRRTEPSA